MVFGDWVWIFYFRLGTGIGVFGTGIGNLTFYGNSDFVFIFLARNGIKPPLAPPLVYSEYDIRTLVGSLYCWVWGLWFWVVV